MASGLSSPPSDARADAHTRALLAASTALAKNGHDVALLDVGEIISIIDWFVLASASNTVLVRTIVEEIELAMRDYDGSRPIGIEGVDDATWVLLDFGDVVVHVFLDETREYYDLDRLWADATRFDVTDEPASAGQASR